MKFVLLTPFDDGCVQCSLRLRDAGDVIRRESQVETGQAYADHGLNLKSGRKTYGGAAATSNRTRENRPSGIIGALGNTAMAEIGSHSTIERVETGHSRPKVSVRSVSIPIGGRSTSGGRPRRAIVTSVAQP